MSIFFLGSPGGSVVKNTSANAGELGSIPGSGRSPRESEVIQSCPTLYDPLDCSLARFLCPWNFPGKNTGVGCHFLLQGIFPTQGLNPGLLRCRQTLYHLSHQGSPKEGNGYSLLYSCLENSMDRGAWWATVRGVTKDSNMT